jgi:hypothetical protein
VVNRQLRTSNIHDSISTAKNESIVASEGYPSGDDDVEVRLDLQGNLNAGDAPSRLTTSYTHKPNIICESSV